MMSYTEFIRFQTSLPKLFMNLFALSSSLKTMTLTNASSMESTFYMEQNI